jgi:hypothetical protein
LTEFLTAILAFPTVVFTILLGVVVVYWLFVLLGALDIDLLGHADGHGGHDLHLEGHGHADGHFDGHGHFDGPVDHGHDVHDGHDAHDGHGAGGVAGLIQALGLGGVPVTVMLSILILAAWSFCLGAMQLLGGSPGWLLFAAALLSLTIAIPLTSLLVRPLRQFFVTLPATRHRDLLGKICTITTLRVDERYGQAEIEDGGAGLLVQVRANGSSLLARGDRALIFDYKDEVFHVAPVDEALRQGLDNLA